MADLFGGEHALRKAEFVADVVNRTLHDLIIRCAKTEEVRNYYYISLIGYGSTIGSAFAGNLAGKNLVPISEVANTPARIENRTKRVPDGAGGLVETQVRFPVWIDPVSGGGTPMCEALRLVHGITDQWISEHRTSFPPTILHLTDGESTDGDPSAVAQSILEQSTLDGNALLFNCHVSSRHSLKIEYPSDPTRLPDEFARMLFGISSPLPEPFRNTAAEIGLAIPPGARGFVFNADPVSVAQFFNIGTRAADLR